MSIEMLEKMKRELRTDYIFSTKKDSCVAKEDLFIGVMLENLISTLKHQSDQIADLKQELAKKEDVIDVNDIKEVKNING